jgi:histidinol dehydrogenase
VKNMVDIKRFNAAAKDFWSQLDALLAWESVSDEAVSGTVREIIQAVQQRGDAAVIEYTNRFDRMQAASMADLTLDASRLDTALAAIPSEQRQALEVAAERLRSYHQHQKMESWSYTEADGTLLGQ